MFFFLPFIKILASNATFDFKCFNYYLNSADSAYSLGNYSDFIKFYNKANCIHIVRYPSFNQKFFYSVYKLSGEKKINKILSKYKGNLNIFHNYYNKFIYQKDSLYEKVFAKSILNNMYKNYGKNIALKYISEIDQCLRINNDEYNYSKDTLISKYIKTTNEKSFELLNDYLKNNEVNIEDFDEPYNLSIWAILIHNTSKNENSNYFFQADSIAYNLLKKQILTPNQYLSVHLNYLKNKNINESYLLNSFESMNDSQREKIEKERIEIGLPTFLQSETIKNKKINLNFEYSGFDAIEYLKCNCNKK